MSNNDLTIGISGAGIAGLVMALSLAKRGMKSIIFEREENLQEVGAGIQLSANASRCLIDLGLSSALNAVASAPRSIDVYRGQSAKKLATIPLGATAEKRYGAPYLVIHRADLQKLLLNAASKSALIDLQLGSAVDDVVLRDDKAFARAQAFDWFIAADGVRSPVRLQHYKSEPVDSGLIAWRGTLAMEDRPAFFSASATTLCIGREGHLVAYPVASGQQLNIVAITSGDLSGFAPWHCSITAAFETETEWTKWPLKMVAPRHVANSRSWVKDKLIFIGDAVHGMLPFAAQGGAMAIEDAVTLADALVAFPTAPQAIAIWSDQRAARVSAVAALARKNRTLYHLPEPMASARDLGMKMLGPDRLLARQDWIYGFEPAFKVEG